MFALRTTKPGRTSKAVARRSEGKLPRAGRRPRLEALEDRSLLTITLGFGDAVQSVVADGLDGNYVVAGGFSNSADFDPTAGVAWRDAAGGGNYIAKYSPSNTVGTPSTPVWIKQVSTTPGAFVANLDLARDSFDNIYLSGAFRDGSITIDSTTLTATSPATLIAKFDSGGNLLWAEKLGEGATGTDPVVAAEHLTLDGAGGLYISGFFRGTDADFDPGGGTYALTSASSQEQFIVQLDTNGNFHWAHRLGPPAGNIAWPGDIAADATGVYLTGAYDATLQLDPGTPGATTLVPPHIPGNDIDGYLVKLNPDGSFSPGNGRQFVGSNSIWAIAADGANVYFATTPLRGVNTLHRYDVNLNPVWDKDLDSGTRAVEVQGDSVYVATTIATSKYSAANGTLTWSGSTTPSFEGKDVAADSAGNVITVGSLAQGTFDVDPSTTAVVPINTSAGGDGFVWRLNNAGNYQSAFTIAGWAMVIDDEDPGYTKTGSGWRNVTGGGSYLNDYDWHKNGNGSNKAQWVFNNVPAGNYEVYVSWGVDSRNATNAQYKVNGVNAPQVNQRVAAGDALAGNCGFKSLGRYNITSGTATVVLSDAANGYISADGVILVARGQATTALAAGLSAAMTSGSPSSPSGGLTSPKAVDAALADAAAAHQASTARRSLDPHALAAATAAHQSQFGLSRMAGGKRTARAADAALARLAGR